jgi:small subunit ribosomal protein S11
VRGQRTKTNARTRKGPRKGAIAKKKTCSLSRHGKKLESMANASTRRTRKKAKKKEGARQARRRRRSRSAARSASSTTARAHPRVVQQHDITITDTEGNVVAWSSAGGIGFKGSRKGTPFAATQAAINAGNAAKTVGMRSSTCGQGPGLRPRVGDPRAADVGIEVKSIRDVTPIPHNGCRPPKRRRVSAE